MDNSSYSDSDSFFERNAQLDHLRSGLHVKAMKMMQQLIGLEKSGPPCATSLEQRGLLQLLNYLIVDYFDWFGYKNTLQTFAIETGERSRPKPREKLQRDLNVKFENADLPILLHLMIKESTRNNDNLMDKNKGQHIPQKVNAGLKKSKTTQMRNRLPKDLPAKAKPVKRMKKPAPENESSSAGKPSKNEQKIRLVAEIDIPAISVNKDMSTSKVPNKVKGKAKHSFLITDMLAKMRNMPKHSVIPAKKKRDPKDAGNTTTKELPKKVENANYQRDTKVPQTKVNVRQSMADTKAH